MKLPITNSGGLLPSHTLQRWWSWLTCSAWLPRKLCHPFHRAGHATVWSRVGLGSALPSPAEPPSGLSHEAQWGRERASKPNTFNKCKETQQMEQTILDPCRLHTAGFGWVITNRTAASSIMTTTQNREFCFDDFYARYRNEGEFPAFYFKIAQDKQRLLVP